MVVGWGLFVPAARPVPGNFVIDTERIRFLLFKIPDLSRDVPFALRSLFTAPWFNHDAVQLVYVTVLLVVFGVPFEARWGSARLVGFFFGTAAAAAIVAGLLLHVIYPRIAASPFFEHAWERTWSGGSAGAFGVIGATAARLERPWLLLGVAVAWEAFVVWWRLRGYTPAFHLSALAIGFLAARILLPARSDADRAGGALVS